MMARDSQSVPLSGVDNAVWLVLFCGEKIRFGADGGYKKDICIGFVFECCVYVSAGLLLHDRRLETNERGYTHWMGTQALMGGWL